MNTGIRPDFAQGVMEARRNSLREMLYLNLWQVILQDADKTATEALIRAQEKGEMLGPVGISLSHEMVPSVWEMVAVAELGACCWRSVDGSGGHPARTVVELSCHCRGREDCTLPGGRSDHLELDLGCRDAMDH